MNDGDRQQVRAGFLWGMGLAAASFLMGCLWQLGNAVAAWAWDKLVN